MSSPPQVPGRLDVRISAYRKPQMIRVDVSDASNQGAGYYFEVEPSMARWLAGELLRQADIIDPPGLHLV